MALFVLLFSTSLGLAQGNLSLHDSTENERTLRNLDSTSKSTLNSPSWFEGIPQWCFIPTVSFDRLQIRGPLTFSQTSDGISNCVRTGYNGSSSHIGAAAGIGYGDFSLLLRYSDLSGNLDTIQYDFRTIGLELGYRYHPLKSSTFLDGIGIIFAGNVDIRINKFTEGFGISRTVVTGAPTLITRLGIGLDYQFRFKNFSIGPEFQFKKSFTNLAPGDPIDADEIIAGIKGFFGGSSSAISMIATPMFLFLDLADHPCPGSYNVIYWDDAKAKSPPPPDATPVSLFITGSDPKESNGIPRGIYWAKASKSVFGRTVESDIQHIDNAHDGISKTASWNFQFNIPCSLPQEVNVEVSIEDSKGISCPGLYDISYWSFELGKNGSGTTIKNQRINGNTRLAIKIPCGHYWAVVKKAGTHNNAIESELLDVLNPEDLNSTTAFWKFKLTKLCH